MARELMTDLKPARTVADLAAATGLDRKTVIAAIISGELPGYKAGARYVIPGEAFEDFLHGRWEPRPRRLFADAIRPQPQAVAYLRRRSAS